MRVLHPASGLVTALEPVMRACSGTWIAHGSGTANREVVDRHDRVGLPPENPRYRIRRVWLSAEEEAGYYYGFSNEGLWPLCHIAHVRPTFRAEDWNRYVEVNKRFARTVVAESRSANPSVLVQDYHLALLPKLVRDQLPDGTIITLWHIPWPNPEAFGILPWREEVLAGLLGSWTITFVYNHHTRELEHALTDMQHKSFHQIFSTLHVHLDAHNCLEVLVVKGKGQEIRKIADRLIGTRGVKHGKLTMTTTGTDLS